MDKNNNPYVGHKLAKHGPPSSSIVGDQGLNGGKKEKKIKKRGGREGEAMAALMGACKLARDLEDKLKGGATIAWDQDREEEEEELVDQVALPPSTNNIFYPQLVGASSRIVDAFNHAILLLCEISSGGTLSRNISSGSGRSSPQKGPEIDPATEGPPRKEGDRPGGGDGDEEETPKIIKGKGIVKRGISSGASDSSCSSPGSSDHNIGQGSKSKDPPNSSAQQENVGGVDKIKKRKAMSRFTIRVPCNNMDMSSDTPSDDGFSWRKYGQKNILGSNYPRSYYKCTHRKNVECPALKQVQRLDEDPSSFMVTYRGEHSCRSTESNTPIATIPSSLHHLALQQYCLNYNPFFGLTTSATSYQDLNPNPNSNLYPNSHINPNPNIYPNSHINPNPIFDITSRNSGISLLVDPSPGSNSNLASLLSNAKLDPNSPNFEFSLGNKPSVSESNENLNYASFIASQTCYPSLSLAPEASSCAMASTPQFPSLGVSGAWVQENPLSITSGGYDQIVQDSSHRGRIFFTPTTSEEESSQTRVPRHESPRGNSDQAMNPSEVASQHMTTIFSYEPSIFNTNDDLWGN